MQIRTTRNLHGTTFARKGVLGGGPDAEQWGEMSRWACDGGKTMLTKVREGSTTSGSKGDLGRMGVDRGEKRLDGRVQASECGDGDAISGEQGEISRFERNAHDAKDSAAL